MAITGNRIDFDLNKKKTICSVMDFLLLLMIFNSPSSGLGGFWDGSTSYGNNCSHVFNHGWVQPGCYIACSYYCDDGYEKGLPHITLLECSSDNEWTWKSTVWYQIKDLLCQPKHCQVTIPNGQLSTDCTTSVGSACEYSCNAGYEISVWSENIICQTSTQWSKNPHQLCTNNQQCPYDILHGELVSSCTRGPGDTCTFECNEEYMSTHPSGTITCGTDTNWDSDLAQLCMKIVCPTTIPNGEISTVCSDTRDYNQKCYSYGCSSGYEKPRQAVTLTCNKSAIWDWDRALSDSPCLNSNELCPRTIQNGRIDQFCDRRHGSQCEFVCNEGCTKYSLSGFPYEHDELTCGDNSQWNTPQSGVCRDCDKTTTKPIAACQSLIPNGGIDPSCNIRYGKMCYYHCTGRYFPKYEHLYCTSSGYWENEATACIDEVMASHDEASATSSSAVIIGGIVAGALGAVVIINVVIVVWCIRGGSCKRSAGEPGTVITYHSVASNASETNVIPTAPNLSDMPLDDVRTTEAVTWPSAPKYQTTDHEKTPPSYIEVVTDPGKFNI